MDKTPIEAHIASRNSQVDHTLLWHYRLGHLHPRVMKTCQIHKLGEGTQHNHLHTFHFVKDVFMGNKRDRSFPSANADLKESYS